MENMSNVIIVACISINLLVAIVLMYRGITKKEKKRKGKLLWAMFRIVFSLTFILYSRFVTNPMWISSKYLIRLLILMSLYVLL